jgi:hypothetical protein
MTNARQAGRCRFGGKGSKQMPNVGGHKAKRPSYLGSSGGSLDISLTMSYFHTGTRTIIGAEAFHFPVRDGKEWDHLAMVIRLNWVPTRSHERAGQLMEKRIGEL